MNPIMLKCLCGCRQSLCHSPDRKGSGITKGAVLYANCIKAKAIFCKSHENVARCAEFRHIAQRK